MRSLFRGLLILYTSVYFYAYESSVAYASNKCFNFYSQSHEKIVKNNFFTDLWGSLFPKPTKLEVNLTKKYNNLDSRELLKTRKKIKNMLFEEDREKWFRRNYFAAMNKLELMNIKFNWVGGKDGYHRGMMLIPNSKSKSLLSQQIAQLKELTSYDFVYSANFSWTEKMRGIFSGTSIDLPAPDAGADRSKNVIYATDKALIEGRITPFEGHEYDHAILNKLESEAIDTGILLPKVFMNTNSSGYITGIMMYPAGIDFQEIYTFANQIYRLGNELIHLHPKFRFSQEKLEDMQQLIDNYLDLIGGIKYLTRVAQSQLVKEGIGSLTIKEENDQTAKLSISLGKGAEYFIQIAKKERVSIASNDEVEKMKVVKKLNQRLDLIEDYCAKVLSIYHDFLESEIEVPFGKDGLWTPEFVRLFSSAKELVFDSNLKFTGQRSSEVNERLKLVDEAIDIFKAK